MSFSTFFIGITIVTVLSIFVRKYWIQLLLVWTILRAIFWLSIAAFCSALFWMIFIENYTSGPIDGFWRTYLFFFLSYSIMSTTFVFVVFDIYRYFKGFIRSIFKK